MNISDNLLTALASALFGSLMTILIASISNRRTIFGYNVMHNRIGLSADDPVYGSVRVLWNENPMDNLYLSTVEIRNEGFKDFDGVTVRIFSNDTRLLTERTGIDGTTMLIHYTEGYIREIHVPEGCSPSPTQTEIFSSRRDYIVNTINRGQLLRFEFLNSATSSNQPSIWVDIVHKGVVCKFKTPPVLFYGVPQVWAAWTGTMICLIGVLALMRYDINAYVISLASFFLGWISLIPGACFIKILRGIRKTLEG